MPDKLNLHEKAESAMELFLEPYQNSPYIQTLVEDKENFQMQVLFDTGMNGMFDIAIEHLEVMNEHDVLSDTIYVSEGSNSHGFYGKAENSLKYRFRVPRLWLDLNSSLRNVDFYSTSNVNSRIGMKLLRYGDMILDYKNKINYYESHSEEAPDVSEKRSPISPVLSNGKLVVGIIWDEALRNEISLGDKILSYNGLDLDNMSECELFTIDLKLLDEKINILKIEDKEGNVKEIQMEKY